MKAKVFKSAINKLSTLLSSKGCRTVFRGTECCTDGNTIYLPSVDLLDDATADKVKVDAFIKSLYGFVVHEVGHVLFTDTSAWKTFARRGPSDLFMLNAIEDGRVERCMYKLWAGCHKSITFTVKYVLAESKDCSSAPFEFQVALMVAYLARDARWDSVKRHCHPDIVKWVEDNLTDELVDAQKLKSTLDSIALAERILEKIRNRETQPQSKPEENEEKQGRGKDEDQNSGNASDESEEEEEETGEGSNESDDDEEDEEGKESEDGEGEDEGDEEEGSGKGKDDEDSEDSDEGGEGGKGDHGEKGSPTDEDFEDDETGEIQSATPLDEDSSDITQAVLTRSILELVGTIHPSGPDNDITYAPYTTEGDYIGSIPTDEATAKANGLFCRSPDDVLVRLQYAESTVSEVAGPLKSALSRTMIARSSAYQVRGLIKGKLDTRRVWKAKTQPQQVPPRIFSKRFVGETNDVAVLIAINESGSMETKAGRTNFTSSRMAIASGLVIGDVLDALKIRFGIFGHTTRDSRIGLRRYGDASSEDRGLFSRFGDLVIEWVKSFRASWQANRQSMGALMSQCNTYDAEVVRYGTQQLLGETGVSRRIMLMLDDGEPWPNISSHAPRHHRELKRAVKEARNAGVEVIGVGMGTSCVSLFYDQYVIVEDIEKLPNALLEKLGELLANWRRKTA